jgi:hypothetical protein
MTVLGLKTPSHDGVSLRFPAVSVGMIFSAKKKPSGRPSRSASSSREVFFSLSFTAFLICGILAALAGCTLSGTPRDSLRELRSALLDHDAEKALVYIDIDSVVDSFVRDIFLKYQEKTQDPAVNLGIRMGRELVTLARPAVNILVERQVKAAIVSADQWGYFDDIKRASVWYFTITVDGPTATVEPRGKSDVRFKMAKGRNGIWRIVEIARK